ncbi:carboxypeptidase-like regulatory domain-containing protein [Cohnella abietis]|uniref:Lipoprotein n=1 Tax=Cohnella abietis TaxID=2507935 RepID=A0A3T1D648_9BACL|nr:carboxypeptidase-like regulatory domain-containing protein [Cohnella abietis]BBI33544.1 hypothetical protein KCTCHS21_29430 [Cohnella abietis]
MRRRLTLLLLTSIVAASMLLAGCTDNNNNAEQAPTTTTTEQTSTQASIELEQTAFPLIAWKMDNSHLIPVKGKVLSDGKPVVGVEVGITGKRMMTTDENGSFELLVDQSIPQSIPLQISSTEQATIDGKALGSSAQEKLKVAVSHIDVYYPIQITEVKADSSNPEKVEVHARAKVEEGQTFPKISLDKYAIQGTVKDANGNPVEGAMVSIIRDNGEGFSRSQPSNAKGEYRLFYSPEEDEDLILNVHVGETRYTLPENKVYRFPDETSVNTDITLPETGTVITDKPPTLVSKAAKGAQYWAQVIGLSVDPSVEYTISLPQEDGSFVLKIDKAEWDKSPKFYQTQMRHFSETEMKEGDFIPSTWIPAPSKGDPAGIAPQSL